MTAMAARRQGAADARSWAVRPAPDGLSFEELAAIPVAYGTSWHALVRCAQVQAGERVLVHAAGSGVGSAALQLAKALGAWVVVTKDGGAPWIYPAAGGTPRRFPGAEADDRPLGWAADGQTLFVRRISGGGAAALIERLEVATGRRSAWKEVRPSENAGVFGITSIKITPDGRAYAYTFSSAIGTLYLADGLK